MKNNWNVTFEVFTPESYEDGEADERGFEIEDASFRDAVHAFQGGYYGYHAESADSWPVDGRIRWLEGSIDEDHDHFTKGIDRRRALHIPDQITPSSRKRLARLFGLKVRA